MEIMYRGFHTGDTSQIVDLYNAVFAESRTADQWRWAYADNPSGHGAIMLAFAGPRMIGHVAGVPLAFRHGTQCVNATRLQHAVVHPDFHRRGAFTKALAHENARSPCHSRRRGVFGECLARLTTELSRKGMDFVVGFPNDNSLPAFRRSGRYSHIVDVFPWTLPLSRVSPRPADLIVEISDTARFTDADAACAEKLLEPIAIRTRRDRRYLNWRYHPACGRRYTVVRIRRDGQLTGWAVVKPYVPGGSLDLVECVLPPEPLLMSAMLGALAERFRSAAVDHCSLWSMEHYPLHGCLVSLGFTVEPRPTHVVIATLSGRCGTLGTEPSAYYLAMGDSDVY